MIKKFEEFINEEKYYEDLLTLSIRVNEYNPSPKVKSQIEKIVEIGEGDNKIVLTKYNTEPRDSIWSHEAFLYPFFEREEAEKFISEIVNYCDIDEYKIFPTTDKSSLARKYFLK